MRSKRLAAKKKEKVTLCPDEPSRNKLDARIDEDAQANFSIQQTVYPASSHSMLLDMDVSGSGAEGSVMEQTRLFEIQEEEAPLNSDINEQLNSILHQLVPGAFNGQLPPILHNNDGIEGSRSIPRQKKPHSVERVGTSSFVVPLEASSNMHYDTQPSVSVPQVVQTSGRHSELSQSVTIDKECTSKSVDRRITRQVAGKMRSDVILAGQQSPKITLNVLLDSTGLTAQPPIISLPKSTAQAREDTASSAAKKRRVTRLQEEEQTVSNLHQEDPSSETVCGNNSSSYVMPRVQPIHSQSQMQLASPSELGDAVQSVMRQGWYLNGHEEQEQQNSNVYGRDQSNPIAPNHNLPDSGIPHLTLHNTSLMHLLHPVRNDDTDNGGKRGRGPTMLHKLWAYGCRRLHVDINKYGQPIGPHASNFGNFLGTIARNGKIAPIDYENWRKIPKTFKDDMWSIIMSRFDIDPRCKKRVLTDIAGKWRGWKSQLKRNYYSKHNTDEERLAVCDERVESEQWKAIIAFWNSEGAKARSEKNKINRSKLKFGHTSGAKSFARLREEEREKRPDHEELTREEIFLITRHRKDKTPLNDEAKIVIDKIHELLAQRATGGSPENSSTQDILSQVLGKDRNGRVRTFGLGLCPSEFGTPHKEETKDRISVVESKINQMQSLLEQVLTKLNNFQSAIDTIPTQSNETESSVQGVSLLSLFTREVVAQGYMVTKDPCAKVGGVELGNKFWEVVVEAARVPDEELIRPFEEYKTVGDVEGISIAWPSLLVVEE